MSELSAEEKAAFIEHSLLDPVFFCKSVVPHWFPPPPGCEIEIPWFHRGILAILWREVAFLDLYGEIDLIIDHFEYVDPASGETHKIFSRNEAGELEMFITPFFQIRMPRGYSKTTLCNARMLCVVLNKIHSFPVYISYAANHAEDQLSTVKKELEENATIHAVWGNLKPKQDQGQWRQDQIDLLNGVHLRARGRGAQIRGMNVGAQRPNFILIDDAEDRESVATEEQRQKTRDWLYKDVIPALPTNDPTAPLGILGTLLHTESLLVTIEKDPRFTTVKFGTTTKQDPEYGSIWPLVRAKTLSAYDAAVLVDQLASYLMEYEGQIRNEKTSIFKERYISYGAVSGEPKAFAVAMDPAISERRTADYAAIVGVSMGLRTGFITIEEVWAKRGATPRDLINEFFAFRLMFPDAAMGIESVAYQASLIHLMREEMFRKKDYFEVIGITHSTGIHKDARIKGILQPRYAAGVIKHAKKFTLLESQLKDFPNGKKDLPDATAMAVALLDPYAAAAADETQDLGADEYPPLVIDCPV